MTQNALIFSLSINFLVNSVNFINFVNIYSDHMKTAYSSVLLIFLFFIGTRSFAQTIDTTLVEFVQGDKVYSITTDAATITLEKKPFSVRFYNRKYDEANEKFYAAQIAVLNKEDKAIQAGQATDGISYFSPGTGNAMSENDYDFFFIDDDGHNYMFYATEQDRRLHFLSGHGDWLKLEWRIDGYFDDSKDEKLENLKYDQLFFIFLFDRNLNEKIDEGELKKVVVSFK